MNIQRGSSRLLTVLSAGWVLFIAGIMPLLSFEKFRDASSAIPAPVPSSPPNFFDQFDKPVWTYPGFLPLSPWQFCLMLLGPVVAVWTVYWAFIWIIKGFAKK
jgi:hypothetical protein